MISIRNLTRNYGSVRALNSINLDIGPRGVVGLLGPNGAGKTTLMRVLTGYVRPSSGVVRVDGTDVSQDPERVKRLIGYLPEFAPLYPDMVVYDYLRYVAGIRDVAAAEADERVREVSNLCGLNDVMHKRFRELSRGYRQRVGMAHAMVGDPAVLVLDEPTSGLDPNQIVKIRSIIREQAARKVVLLSTHILAEAETACDRIVILSSGRIVADGTPEKLQAELGETHRISLSLRGVPADKAVAVFSRVTGVASVVVPTAAAGSDRDGASRGGVVDLELTANTDVSDAVYKAVKDSDWMLTSFTTDRSSLEDVFRGLTEQQDVGEGEADE